MKPKGLVFAAFMISQTLRPILWHIRASSFTMAILTLRKVFSRSFTISAERVEETGITSFIAWEYKRRASSVQLGVTPPTILVISFVLYLGLPGSTLSGENAKKKSFPTFRPLASNLGNMISSVVPG